MLQNTLVHVRDWTQLAVGCCVSVILLRKGSEETVRFVFCKLVNKEASHDSEKGFGSITVRFEHMPLWGSEYITKACTWEARWSKCSQVEVTPRPPP